ncbi:RNA 2'-phosphotransferase [Shimazuella alba]|uniref:Probable RNA 2'-phosphotransferase n=1 Tax=Shimazuella alba TaxID=2690964 RepID=A0A6I4VUJ1_9BACL|nr:RNA 2'-phosphotransferase [Shimazuella alba]MXQ54191.1 RNA 2'-phosphotransferase [Shimazuella alba]
MDNKKLKSKSKFLSLILRHQPELIGIKLDQNGWVSISAILNACKDHGKPLTMEELQFIVENNNKKRFAFDEKLQRIRANQGHSVKVDLGYEPKSPPSILYHGTAIQHLGDIIKNGLVKKSRHHIHLSVSADIALEVGKRHGVPVVLTIYSYQMEQDGYDFYVSDNGVWLTDHVPAKYILQKDHLKKISFHL